MSLNKDQTKDKARTLALGKLLKAAEQKPMIRKVLEAYRDHVKYSTNIKAINNTKFNATQLEECLNFLKLKTKKEDKTPIYTNKATLADRIVLMIESYFPAKCQDCEDDYENIRPATDLVNDRVAPFTCFLCLQGSHSCELLLEKKRKSDECAFPHPVWLCEGCYTKNNLLTPNHPKRARHPSQCVTFQTDTPTQDPKAASLAAAAAAAEEDAALAKKKAAEAKTAVTVAKESVTNPIQGDDDITDRNAAITEAEAELEKAETAAKEAERTAADTLAKATDAKEAAEALAIEAEVAEATTEKDKPAPAKVICERYRRTTCPHGRLGTTVYRGKTCEFAHPKTCFRFCKFGPGTDEDCCNGGSQCKSGFHPILCKYSVRDKICTDRSCTYIHVRGTKRQLDYQSDSSQRAPLVTPNQTNFRSSSKTRDTRQSYPSRRKDDDYNNAYNPRQRTFSTSSNSTSFPALKNKYAPLLSTPDDAPKAEPRTTEKDTTSFWMKFMEEMKISLQKTNEAMRADFQRDLNEFKRSLSPTQVPLLQQPVSLPCSQMQQHDFNFNQSQPQSLPQLQMMHQMMPQTMPQMMPFQMNNNPVFAS